MKRKNILEVFLLIVVVVSLVAIPFGIRKIDNYYRTSKFPEGSKVITLYGMEREGIWTKEPVTSFNYWWKTFPRAEINVNQGDSVVFRIFSADVYHGFGLKMAGLRINEKVKPGQLTEVRFTPEHEGVYEFRCTVKCGKPHTKMAASLVVKKGEVAAR